MAMINDVAQNRSGGIVAALRNIYAGLVDGYRMRNEYQRTVEELQRLSERELADIGLVRADIPAAAARRTLESIR
jgi:uncharacterized protein YjiS (DUF1127 family)